MHRDDWSPWPGEAQRREEKRSEARLAEGLQRLDQAKHYHLNTLTREQRRLNRDLISIKTGNPWRRGLQSLGLRTSIHDVHHPAVSHKKTLLPVIPLAGRETDSHKSMKPQSESSLQARVQEFISSGENRAEHSTETLCLPNIKRQTVTSLTTTTTNAEREECNRRERNGEQEMQRDREREGHTEEREIIKDREKKKERKVLRERERDNERENEINGNRCLSSPVSFPSEMLAPDGYLRAVHMLPNFPQALAEARKARYIRHRGQPLCEQVLTIREIFSRDTPSL
ncbi:coiled-coil domain-containing protein 190 [Myxocyprinus asiaticus]|uniref:coiled-coil domain-containing protein 190 n=1 Tax=Myxocyprinus asiaticus TaxID=70543 RepID=UPI0022239958|nr:coiled-coil domain-containing protein 190 [Myxocyprinus asiaticus]XP_051500963.1 coiled-coil domain-containing protein 190 [Myxocyprinus asiaticus]